MGDREPELVILCKEARPQGENCDTNPATKTLTNIFFACLPAYKMCRDKDGAEIEGMANQSLAKLETHFMGEGQP